MGWVAEPIYSTALADQMTEAHMTPAKLADEVCRTSAVRVTRQRISQLRAQKRPTGCSLELAEQISRVLGCSFSLLWRVIPINEAARKLSDPRITVSAARNIGAQTAQAGRRTA